MFLEIHQYFQRLKGIKQKLPLLNTKKIKKFKYHVRNPNVFCFLMEYHCSLSITTRCKLKSNIKTLKLRFQKQMDPLRFLFRTFIYEPLFRNLPLPIKTSTNRILIHSKSNPSSLEEEESLAVPRKKKILLHSAHTLRADHEPIQILPFLKRLKPGHRLRGSK